MLISLNFPLSNNFPNKPNIVPEKIEIPEGSNFNKSLISLIVSTIIFYSCTSDLNETIYKLKFPKETDIIFSNKIVETDEFNILSYNNMYMGGGVSIGDINNDELPDIFLTANQEPNRLFLNKGDLQFEDITESSGI